MTEPQPTEQELAPQDELTPDSAPVSDSTPGSDNLSAPADAQPDHTRRNRIVIALMLTATFVVFLNETIIGVALPHLIRDLRIEPSTAQWLSTAFMLTMAVVIPITGFLIQRFSTRAVFIAAMSFFSFGTAIAAISPGFEMLLAGRIVQAIGTAIMLPLLMTTVMTLVPPQARGRVMGNISIVMSMAPAVGPAVGGAILDNLHDWRWIFILVLPIALGALVLGAIWVQNVTTPSKAPIDVFSVILSAFGFGGLVYGLSSLGEAARGETLVAPWVPLVIGAAALALFITRQIRLQRDDRALLDLRTFRARGFTVAIILMTFMMGTLFGVIILLPLYTQDVLGLTPLYSGLLTLPGSLLMGLLGPLVGRLYDRVGPRLLILPASIVVSLAMWSMTLFGENTPWWFVLASHVVLSLGLAFMFTPLFTSGLGAIKPQLYSHGSATVGTVQQLAAASGTALFIALLTIGKASLTADGADTISALSGGMHWAFVAGGILSLFGIVVSLFVPKPDPELSNAGHGA